MQFGIDFKEPSTLKGLILVIATIIIGIGWLIGRVETNDVMGILTAAMGSTGLIGFLVKGGPGK